MSVFGFNPSFRPKMAENMNEVMNKAKTFTTYQQPSLIPFVSFVDDDGAVEAIDNLYPVFSAKGVPCNCAIITGLVGNATRLTVNNLKTLLNAGWELLGHGDTYTNNLTEFLTEADLENDLMTCRDFLRNIGSYKTGFVYPQSAYNAMIRRSVLKYFDYSFAESGFATPLPFGRPRDPSRIARIPFGYSWGAGPTVNGVPAANTLAYYSACVDYAKTNNLWLVFMVHSWDADTNLTILGQLIDYIQAQSVTIGTTSEGYEIHGNRLFVGDMDTQFFAIHEDSINVTRDTNILLADPITAYKLDTITISYIGGTQAGSEGWPETTAGVLTTNRVSQYWYWNWQEYTIYGSNRKWVRRPTSDAAWSAWTPVIRGAAVNAPLTTALTTYEPYTITYGEVSGATAISEGWPEAAAGKVLTYRVSNFYYWCWQEYHIISSNRVYVRYATANTTWSAWMTRATGTKEAANADTALTFDGGDTVSKADIVTLQTEVNQLKATLRAFNMIAT